MKKDMEALPFQNDSNDVMKQKWMKMFVLSIVFHLVVFSSIFIVPTSTPTMRMKEVVYEVNLVDSPVETRQVREPGRPSVSSKNMTVPSKASATERIGRPKMEEKALVVAKRTVAAKKIKTPEAAPSKLLDEAITKIEKTVKAQENTPAPVTTPSRVVTRSEAGSRSSLFSRSGVSGISMDIYRSEVHDLLYSNWSYATALEGPSSNTVLSTVVLLTVQSDGTILSTAITKSSGNAQFDQSALNAVRRSGTLPRFPENYQKAREEIEINFNNSDVKNK